MVCKELSSGTVGWIFARGTVSFGVRKGGGVVSVRVVVTTFKFTFQ